LGAAVALLFLAGLGAAVLSLFIPLVTAEARVISEIDFEAAGKALSGQFSDFQLRFSNLIGERSNADLTAGLQKQWSASWSQMLGKAGLGGLLSGFLGTVGNTLVAVFSILFMTFFFLKDRNLFFGIIQALTPQRLQEKVDRVIEDTSTLLTRYFVGLAIQVSIVTVIITLGLSILGVPNAFLIGFLAGLMNLVPYVGPLVAAGTTLLILLTTQFQNPELWGLVGKAALVFGVAQLVDNFFTQPVIFAGSVKAHPLEIFLLISIAGSLAGVAGMVLAIPAYSLLRIVAKEFFSEFKVVDSLTKKL
jgi:predicted PurR-regulated permease PerM